MSCISFTINIAPQSLQYSGRRERIVQPKGKRPFIHHFKDKEAEAYEHAVATLCAPYRPAAPLSGPVKLGVVFVMPRPQKYLRKKDPEGRAWCISRPDSTNLTKALEDILTAAGFWHDDNQVCRQEIERHFTAKGEAPCIKITIEPLAPARKGELFA